MAARAPSGLGTRGRALWRALLADAPDASPALRVLLEEACRIADRLERLDAILRAETTEWVDLVERYEGTEITVTVNGVLAEARQQALALKAIATEVRQAGRGAKPQQQGGSAIDEIARRRAARAAAAPRTASGE